jgi:hypothetical protein
MKGGPARRLVWLLVALVPLGIFALAGCGSSMPQATPGPDYTMYQGHRWFLNLPAPTPGFIDLGTDDKVTIYNTEQQLVGTYRIEDDGRFSIQITGVSSGRALGVDRAVVDAMDAIGVDQPMFIRSTDSSALVLEARSHTLTFTTH